MVNYWRQVGGFLVHVLLGCWSAILRGGHASPKTGGKFWVNEWEKVFPLRKEGLKVIRRHTSIFSWIHRAAIFAHDCVKGIEQIQCRLTLEGKI